MRTFGHKRPVRDAEREIIGQKESPVKAITIEPLGGAFGADKRRRLVVTLAGGDVIKLKPHGTRREVSVGAADVYRYALMCIANGARMNKLRDRKVAVAARRERQKLAAQERRMRAAAKLECAKHEKA